MSETYTIYIHCTNCNKGITRAIVRYVPKGMTVEEFLQVEKCENCGCKTMREN